MIKIKHLMFYLLPSSGDKTTKTHSLCFTFTIRLFLDILSKCFIKHGFRLASDWILNNINYNVYVLPFTFLLSIKKYCLFRAMGSVNQHVRLFYLLKSESLHNPKSFLPIVYIKYKTISTKEYKGLKITKFCPNTTM